MCDMLCGVSFVLRLSLSIRSGDLFNAHISPRQTPSSTRRRRGGGANSDVRALMRGELVDLDGALRSALNRTSDRTTRLHLLDSRAEIKRILDPDS